MQLVTEYLLVIVQSTASAMYSLCETPADFSRMVAADAAVSVSGSEIRYHEALVCKYTVVAKEISDADGQRFFHIRIEFSGEEAEIPDYLKLLKSIRRTANNAGHCETIWDDTSLYYAQLSYPLIHRAESLMRKLITYFMLTTIGKDWVEVTSPNELKKALAESKKRKQRVGEKLHQVDFIVLKDVLFKSYSNSPIDAFYSALTADPNREVFAAADLKDFLPKSNWDRYFSKIVECEGAHIDKAWRELYDLRCDVAHNALVGKVEYERILVLVNDLTAHLQTALDNIGRVHVPSADKEQVAENIATNVSATYGEFIDKWKTCEFRLRTIGGEWGADISQTTVLPDIVRILSDMDALDDALALKITEILGVRNRLVRGAGGPLPDHDVKPYIAQLEEVNQELGELLRPPPLTWRDEIATTLRALGGEGLLADIYEHIGSTTTRELPENWKACIRYTLQLHSSDTKTFAHGSGEDVFQRVGRGRWKLRDL